MRKHRYTDRLLIEKVNSILALEDHKPYTFRAVQPWREGRCVPRPPVVAAIHIVTSGEVTYQDHVDTAKETGLSTRDYPPAPKPGKVVV